SRRRHTRSDRDWSSDVCSSDLARALDDAEEPALRASQVTWLPPVPARNPDAVHAAVEQLAADVDLVHVHVDLDVHDPSIAPANKIGRASCRERGQIAVIDVPSR